MLDSIISKICPRWNYLSNHQSDEDGRIIFIWRSPVTTRLLHQTRQSLTLEVCVPHHQPMIITSIYAANTAAERVDLWADLINLQQSLSLDSTSWLVAGDFNQIVSPSEHSSSSVQVINTDMINFRDTLLQLGLFDLRYQGIQNTWSNKQPSGPIAKKLDRALVNYEWISAYPNSSAVFLAPEFSDHTPCLLNLATPLPIAGSKPFKFFNYLSKHPNFLPTVSEAWILAGISSSTLAELSWKLKTIKSVLQNLNSENFSKIQERVVTANNLLKDVQVRALQNPSPSLFQEEHDLREKWLFLRSIEEAYFKQKSRINWLKEGDFNTSYFYRVAVVRAAINSIRSFLLADGTLISDPEAMAILAVNHFKSILAPLALPFAVVPINWFLELIPYRCSAESYISMSTQPDAETISRTIFKMNPNKSPGPDGLTSGFFKASWGILGAEVITAIQRFFTTAFMPSTINSTILTMVPKHPGATAVSDYRPISCCSTLYKAISKILVSKLKPLLPELILPNQTAFVQGRLLVENTVLATELVNGYHKLIGPKKIVIKVDIAKAFDTISWSFVLNCLAGIGVPYDYIRWVEACITTPSFTVGYNGRVHGYFKGKRGLRQGDPLSPYLFVIAMNCLSTMLNKGAEEGKFNYHEKCAATKLTHLCFADDLLIFTDGEENSVLGVLQILEDFKVKSGLAVSIQKTAFYSCGLSTQEVNAISSHTGLTHGSLPIRYLGVPLCTKKLSLLNCEPLLQQVKAKVNTWSARCLSFAGRLLLVNTVIGGITNFWSATFVLPKACIKKINAICGAFLWHGSTEGSHSARVSWETVTLDKSEGGLSCRDLVAWNTACIIKLIWILFCNSGSLWVAWYKAEVLTGSLSNFWTKKPNPKHSWLANKLIKLRQVVYNWLQVTVGNGASTRFWTDHWTPFGKLEEFLNPSVSRRMGIPANATLRDINFNGNWLIQSPRSENQLMVQTYLSTLELSQEEDVYTWKMDGNTLEKYSTRLVYETLKRHAPLVSWVKTIWCKGGIPKHNFLAWLFVNNRCPTRDRLLGWGLTVDPMCLLCNSAPESRDHLLFICPYSWEVWSRTSDRCQVVTPRDWMGIVDYLNTIQLPKLKKKLLLITWQCAIYLIWSERNARLHRNCSRSPHNLLSSLYLIVKNRCSSLRSQNPRSSSAMIQMWMQ